MSQIECNFLDEVKHKQYRVWLSLLFWVIAVVVFVVVASTFTKASDTVIHAVFYGSVLLLYLPIVSLSRVKCPYCQWSAGALPIFRYKFMFCKACGKRIECKSKDA
jgi:hypothetical protein